ncbi:hypothetical protein EDC04DRAFT_1065859 [Pisolithus marmoratus]|nr:hypothetical protein EDC04DRAFT_1065859 [Pisolithus marmoratus]
MAYTDRGGTVARPPFQSMDARTHLEACLYQFLQGEKIKDKRHETPILYFPHTALELVKLATNLPLVPHSRISRWTSTSPSSSITRTNSALVYILANIICIVLNGGLPVALQDLKWPLPLVPCSVATTTTCSYISMVCFSNNLTSTILGVHAHIDNSGQSL